MEERAAHAKLNMTTSETVEELKRLADFLEARAVEADAKAAVHEKAKESADVEKEKRRAKSGRHFAAVCRNAAGKLSAKEKRGAFIPPTLAEVAAEMKRWNLPEREAEKFVAHYSSNGWKVGRNPMMDWKRAVITWREGYFEKHPAQRQTQQTSGTKILAHADPDGWAAFLTGHKSNYQPYRFAPEFLKDEFHNRKPADR